MSEDHKHVLKLILEQERQKSGTGLEADKHFELFSAEQILKSRGFDVDYDQLKAGNVGGDADGGVDGLYCFVNHLLIAEDTEPSEVVKGKPSIELVVIQSTRHAGFTVDRLQKFADFTKRCLRLTADHGDVSALYSSELLQLADKFRSTFTASLTSHPVVQIRFYVASLGDQVDIKVQTQADEFEVECREYFHGVSVDVTCFGADRLLTWYRREIEKTLTMRLANAFPWKVNGVGYVGVVKLPDFYDFISSDGILREHLFESNVRDFQGHIIEVNKGIRDSLEARDSNQEFWWLNNGVTILTSDVQGDTDLLALTDPLIVNGLQTSYVLYDYFASGSGNKADTRTLLVRIIKADDPTSIDKIIRANNSQTAIPKSYLYAGDEVQRNIDSMFRMTDLFYDRRKNHYRRNGAPPAKIVTPAYLAQAVAALVLHRPDDARGRATTLFVRDYRKLFSKSHPMQLYVVCASLMKKVETYVATKKISALQQNNVKWYVAMYLAALVNNSAVPQRTKMAKLDVNAIKAGLFDLAHDAVWNTFVELGGDDKVAKGPELLKSLKAKLIKQFPH